MNDVVNISELDLINHKTFNLPTDIHRQTKKPNKLASIIIII